MAISSNIHQIDEEILREGIASPDSVLTSSRWDGSLLGRPTSVKELAQRVSVFWQASQVDLYLANHSLIHVQTFYGDKAASLMTGLPSSYDGSQDARITTSWPRCPENYNTVSLSFILG